MFKSLKTRLLAYFLIANTFILLTFGYLLYSTAQQGLSQNLDSLLRFFSLDFLADIKQEHYVDAKKIAKDLEEEFQISPLYVKVIYYDMQSKKSEYFTLSSEEKKELFDIPLNELSQRYGIYYYDRGDYRVSSMLTAEQGDKRIFFQLAALKEKHSPLLDQLLILLIIASPIILLVYLLIGNFLMNQMLLPVQDTVDSVKRISAQKLFKRLNRERIPLEIEELVGTFNDLLDRLEESFKRISTFSSDASHELKTPLTVIKGEIDVALRHERSASEYQKVLKEVGEEADRVQETIDQLFFLAQRDSSGLGENFQNIYFDEMLLESISQLNSLAASRKVKIKVTEIVPFTLNANEALLKIVCINLIKNAIIYSPENAEVYVGLKEERENYILQIEDKGYGIKEEELPLIYDRFYRSDKARMRQNGGTGLGLSIVKMILDLHKYEISVQSTVGKGTLVKVSIPKEKKV